MTDEPLIYTCKGNLPVAQLQHAVQWEKTDTYTKMIETYSLDGEVVRSSAHVLAHQGLSSETLTNLN